jgi:FkbM family methyltransferase
MVMIFMVTLKGLFRTLSIVKNPLVILRLKLRKKPYRVVFSNGVVFQVTWTQLRFLRDNFNLVKKYHLQQIDDEVFKITTDSYQLIGSIDLMCTMAEIETGIYKYDYQDKVVLDIGGYEGDSALFFWLNGAKKIVIYEPVLEHRKFICENIRLNKINAVVYSEGIGNEDGEITVAYNRTDACFGLEIKAPQNKMDIRIKDVTRVISESGADIAKIDCEGAEISLITVPKETLRKLEYVMVEAHTSQIRHMLIEKFESSGFVIDCVTLEDINDTEGVSMIYFKRIPCAVS